MKIARLARVIEGAPPGLYGRRRSTSDGRENQRASESRSAKPTQRRTPLSTTSLTWRAAYSWNTRGSSGSRMIRPAHSQHTTTIATPATATS